MRLDVLYPGRRRSTGVDIVVYDDDGTGGLPGTELFRKTLTSVPTGWTTTTITGVTVTSGDFYIAVEKDDASQSIYIDDDSNPTGRSYWHNGSAWVVSSYTAAIRAEVVNDATFDRTNNIVGLTLASPATGVALRRPMTTAITARKFLKAGAER